MIKINHKNKLFIIVVLIIIIISIIPYLFYFNKKEKSICITLNGIDVTDEYLHNDRYVDKELSDDNKKVININSEFGNNKIAIYMRQAECIYSDCLNQICVNTGIINEQYDNELIVCAPHRLVIYYK